MRRRCSRAVVVARLLLVALLVWWWGSFAVAPIAANAAGQSWLHLPNLVFHEAGHVIFAPFGHFVSVLGGSLLQVLVPVVCTVALWRHDDRFGSAVTTWWAGQSLVDLAPYINDARALQLVLLGGYTGAEVEGHDWEYLLQATGLLAWDVRLARAAHVAGLLVMAAAIGAAVWITVAGRGESEPIPEDRFP